MNYIPSNHVNFYKFPKNWRLKGRMAFWLCLSIVFHFLIIKLNWYIPYWNISLEWNFTYTMSSLIQLVSWTGQNHYSRLNFFWNFSLKVHMLKGHIDTIAVKLMSHWRRMISNCDDISSLKKIENPSRVVFKTLKNSQKCSLVSTSFIWRTVSQHALGLEFHPKFINILLIHFGSDCSDSEKYWAQLLRLSNDA